MRIAIANWSRRRIGGSETYLNSIIPILLDLGYELSFLFEVDEPVVRDRITLLETSPAWCVADIGRKSALAALRDWSPDIIYTHGIHDTELEANIIHIAPAIFFAHTFTGTCISGQKTFKSPVATPCSRRFGWQCLLHYYPHRCGGRSPITMFKLYLSQAKRLENLRGYQAIVTHSSYMRAEYIKHDFDPDRVYNLSYYAPRLSSNSPSAPQPQRLDDSLAIAPESHSVELTGGALEIPSRLLFLGRMEFLKGGEIFLDALHQAQSILNRPLHVTFAGDGPDRHKWEIKAASVQAQNQQLSIEFIGWARDSQLDSVLTNCDLLIFPSLWPEPFGLAGLEAGQRGVPVAAFAVGGIPDWLFDGVNGYLAPGDPPTAAGLAQAIVKCLHNPGHYAHLRRGAMNVSQSFEMETHLNALLKVFEKFKKKPSVPSDESER